MSVLLQGLSMPKGNPRTINIYRDGVWCDAYTTENGKAIEVQPHGRLVDSDALLDLLNNCVFPSDMVTTTAVRMAINWIKDAPTVEEAEGGE